MILDVGSGSYCSMSTSENCDGSTCSELSRIRGDVSLQECQTSCRDLEGCNFISWTPGDCLMFDACPALRQYGDGTQGTLSQNICAPQGIVVHCISTMKERRMMCSSLFFTQKLL